jgi:hypothetical protein
VDRSRVLADGDPDRQRFRRNLERTLLAAGVKGNIEAEVEQMAANGTPGLRLPRHLIDGVD